MLSVTQLGLLLPAGLSFGCRRAFDRKLALYFIAPFGLLATGLGYPQHESKAVVAATMSGATSVVLAATWNRLAAYRTLFNLGGCAVMLGSSYFGDKIARDKLNNVFADVVTVPIQE